jgi:hypothetical protein
MIRTQLLLEENQHRQLKRLARASGKSMSAVLREILGEHFDRDTTGMSDLAGLVKDGPDVARDHDRYLYGSARKAGGRGGN